MIKSQLAVIVTLYILVNINSGRLKVCAEKISLSSGYIIKYFSRDKNEICSNKELILDVVIIRKR